MFEISILCVIALAIGYCATLWIMGRRDDVIYGQFIQTEQFPVLNLESPPASNALGRRIHDSGNQRRHLRIDA
jgi:hypothetical protein